MKFSAAKTEPIQMQLAPMLDVVFLLLCFWVVMSLFSQWETELPIQIPTASSGEPPQRTQGEIIINVYPDGRYVVNGRTLSSEALGTLLTRVSELFPGHPVVIRSDETTEFKFVTDVLDRCREADIYNISFATQVPQ